MTGTLEASPCDSADRSITPEAIQTHGSRRCAKRYGGAVFPLGHTADPVLVQDYVALCLRPIEAIDRDRFAVHLDPVNIVTSPELTMEYFNGVDEYDLAAEHIREVAATGGLSFVEPG